MIKITSTLNNGLYSRIEIKGHANAGEYGKDLVCAAVSAVVEGCIYSLKGFNKKEISVKDGDVTINVAHEISHDDQVRLSQMIESLELIASENKKKVQITVKGN